MWIGKFASETSSDVFRCRHGSLQKIFQLGKSLITFLSHLAHTPFTPLFLQRVGIACYAESCTSYDKSDCPSVRLTARHTRVLFHLMQRHFSDILRCVAL